MRERSLGQTAAVRHPAISTAPLQFLMTIFAGRSTETINLTSGRFSNSAILSLPGPLRTPRRRPSAFAVRSHREELMRWYHYLAYFFGGAFLANAVPHFVNGVSGNAFQSPFAHPPGEGLSSALVNVLWGFTNLVIGYLLLLKVGKFDLRRWRYFGVAAAGALMMSVMLARAFGRFHGGL
jgi:hypothetical protein